MSKYLELFETESEMNTPTASPNGKPWVGAEKETNKVRYEKTGIFVVEQTDPDPGNQEK